MNKLAKRISTILYPGLAGAFFTFILYFAVMGLSLRSFLIALVYSSLITLTQGNCKVGHSELACPPAYEICGVDSESITCPDENQDRFRVIAVPRSGSTT